MRKLAAALAFSTATLAASSAFAQMEDFGKSGSMGFSAERLFAFYSAKHKVEGGNGNTDTSSYSGFGFGWGAIAYPFNVPRLGFDYFIIDQLSLGGALGYAKFNDDNDRPTNNGDLEIFMIAPRVGYWIPIGGVVGFWPRGGLTYHSVSPDGDNNDSHGIAMTLEAMFGIGPVEHFAFLVGPTADFDFSGSRECRINGRDDRCNYKYQSFGAQVGLMGWF
jgi:hypothetical protein